MGTSLKCNLPFVKLVFRNEEGEFFTLGSYISWVLTGVNATHITDGCASGFYFADTGQSNGYSGNMKIPKLYSAVKVLGTYQDILIYTPIGDHQISFLGSGAGKDKCLVNIGTATQISCVEELRGDSTRYSDERDFYQNGSDKNYSEESQDGQDSFLGKYEVRPYLYSDTKLHTITGLVGGAKLYRGEGEEAFFWQLIQAIKMLPPKKEILLGGGGASQIYGFIKERLEWIGRREVESDLQERNTFFCGKKKCNLWNIKCNLIKENIGMEGLKTVAVENRIKVGTMLSEIAFPNFPIIAKNSGLDFIIIDNEHGAFDCSVMAALVMNANLLNQETIVRIGDNSRSHITKLADMGAKGFLLPMTNCREDMEMVVRYAKYSPIGKRGVSTTRAHTLYDPPGLEVYMKAANDEMKVYAQIETKSGVENIRDILAVEGMDGVFIGPNDLSVDIGCLADRTPLFAAVEKVAAAAQEAGKPWGIITADKELLAYSKRLGVNKISCGSELNMLINGCKQILCLR